MCPVWVDQNTYVLDQVHYATFAPLKAKTGETPALTLIEISVADKSSAMKRKVKKGYQPNDNHLILL